MSSVSAAYQNLRMPTHPAPDFQRQTGSLIGGFYLATDFAALNCLLPSYNRWTFTITGGLQVLRDTGHARSATWLRDGWGSATIGDRRVPIDHQKRIAEQQRVVDAFSNKNSPGYHEAVRKLARYKQGAANYSSAWWAEHRAYASLVTSVVGVGATIFGWSAAGSFITTTQRLFTSLEEIRQLLLHDELSERKMELLTKLTRALSDALYLTLHFTNGRELRIASFATQALFGTLATYTECTNKNICRNGLAPRETEWAGVVYYGLVAFIGAHGVYRENPRAEEFFGAARGLLDILGSRLSAVRNFVSPST